MPSEELCGSLVGAICSGIDRFGYRPSARSLAQKFAPAITEETCELVAVWVTAFIDEWARRPTPREVRAFLLRPS
jgi:hypothetical protein